MHIKSISKDYGKIKKIMVYNHAVDIEPPRCKLHEAIACQICWQRKVRPVFSPSSIMRTKTRITDLTLANEFDLFTTFTFDPNKVDSFDFEYAKEKMSQWLHNARRYSPDFKYIVIAELHPSSGRIHFHGLFANFKGELIQSFTETGKPRQKNGRNIYNIGTYNWGFSTAVKITDLNKVSSYVQKYITKDMLKISNKKRYFSSKNLIKPKKEYNVDIQEEVFSRPMFHLGTYQEEYYKIYTTIPVKQKKKLIQKKQKTKKVDINDHIAYSSNTN